MDYYFDIKILPDPEFKESVLMNALFKKLHKALFDMHSSDIGVSFPLYVKNHRGKNAKTLGGILRLHGSKQKLENLQYTNWVGPMKGFCRFSQIEVVPNDAKHRIINRWQNTMSISNLRRLKKRGSLKEEEEVAYLKKMENSWKTDLPYLEIQSGSNGHKHRRYLKMGELLDQPVDGDFNQFGLSKTATIPWF